MDCGGYCLSCGRKLKIVKDDKGNDLAYHYKCFEKIVQDIKNFDKIAITQ